MAGSPGQAAFRDKQNQQQKHSQARSCVCARCWACWFAEGFREEPGVEETRLPGPRSPAPDGEMAGRVLQKGPWVPELATMRIPTGGSEEAGSMQGSGRPRRTSPALGTVQWPTHRFSSLPTRPSHPLPTPAVPSPFPLGKAGGVPCEAASLCVWDELTWESVSSGAESC